MSFHAHRALRRRSELNNLEARLHDLRALKEEASRFERSLGASSLHLFISVISQDPF